MFLFGFFGFNNIKNNQSFFLFYVICCFFFCTDVRVFVFFLFVSRCCWRFFFCFVWFVFFGLCVLMYLWQEWLIDGDGEYDILIERDKDKDKDKDTYKDYGEISKWRRLRRVWSSRTNETRWEEFSFGSLQDLFNEQYNYQHYHSSSVIKKLAPQIIPTIQTWTLSEVSKSIFNHCSPKSPSNCSKRNSKMFQVRISMTPPVILNSSGGKIKNGETVNRAKSVSVVDELLMGSDNEKEKEKEKEKDKGAQGEDKSRNKNKRSKNSKLFQFWANSQSRSLCDIFSNHDRNDRYNVNYVNNTNHTKHKGQIGRLIGTNIKPFREIKQNNSLKGVLFIEMSVLSRPTRLPTKIT